MLEDLIKHKIKEDKFLIFQHNYNPLHFYCRVYDIKVIDVKREVKEYQKIYNEIIYKIKK
jgi:hypothetical protein